MNRQQRDTFNRLRALLPPVPASLSNSGGTFLGPAYHFDVVRPGIALYGGRAHEGEPNPMRTVVRLKAKILQVHEVAPGATVGYGAIYRVQRPSRIATIACGYADGFLRALSVATGEAGPVGYIGDYPVPIVGRVSMDFITVDVTDVPEELTRRGGWVEVMGQRVTVDDLTDRAGTIGYELLVPPRPSRASRLRGSLTADGQAGTRGVRMPDLRRGGRTLDRPLRRLRRMEHARRGDGRPAAGIGPQPRLQRAGRRA